jgi:hypothetical protein
MDACVVAVEATIVKNKDKDVHYVMREKFVLALGNSIR